MPLPERLDQPDLAGQMIGGIRRAAVQLREQLRRDPLRFGMLHAMHHAVSRRFDRRKDRLRLEPVQQKTHRRAVVGGKAAGALWFSSRIVDDQIRAARTDAIDLPVEPPPRRFACLIHRKPHARRARVDRQNRCHRIRASSSGIATPSRCGITRAV